MEFRPLVCVILWMFTVIVCLADVRLPITDGVTVFDLAYGDLFFEIVYPDDLHYTFRIRPAKDFGIPFNCTHKKIPLVPVKPIDGCGFPTNAGMLKGHVALVSRGDCSFLSKAIQAEKAGAVAVIVMDSDEGEEELYIDMVVDGTSRDVNIPAAFLLGKNGYAIASALSRLQLPYALINIPVNVTQQPERLLKQPPWVIWS